MENVALFVLPFWIVVVVAGLWRRGREARSIGEPRIQRWSQEQGLTIVSSEFKQADPGPFGSTRREKFTSREDRKWPLVFFCQVMQNGNRRGVWLKIEKDGTIEHHWDDAMTFSNF